MPNSEQQLEQTERKRLEKPAQVELVLPLAHPGAMTRIIINGLDVTYSCRNVRLASGVGELTVVGLDLVADVKVSAEGMVVPIDEFDDWTKQETDDGTETETDRPEADPGQPGPAPDQP